MAMGVTFEGANFGFPSNQAGLARHLIPGLEENQLKPIEVPSEDSATSLTNWYRPRGVVALEARILCTNGINLAVNVVGSMKMTQKGTSK